MDGIAAWEQRWRPFERHESLEVDERAAKDALNALVERLNDNYPFFHPDYAGQMLKPPHPVALAAYLASARINPNNHALDGGPATAALEREVIEQFAALFGYREHLGHLTSSGTIANLEALWIASRLHPGRAIAFSSEAHYTHARMCEMLGVPTVVVPVDACGKLDLDALELDRSIGTVVVTAGTTATGAVDPIDDVVRLARERNWRVHLDAAYGGFFKLIAGEPEARMNAAPWNAFAQCDSIVVDPHKHGLQPYGCGCVIFADPAVGAFYKHDSPYTYFTSKELHLGEISLECSRAGAAAASLWTTLLVLPLKAREGLGAVLLACRSAALRAVERIHRGGRLTPVVTPELDILTVAPLRRGERASARDVSARTEKIFAACQNDQQRPFYLAKWRVGKSLGEKALPAIDWDDEACTVIRSVLMKPEHAAIVDDLIDRLERY